MENQSGSIFDAKPKPDARASSVPTADLEVWSGPTLSHPCKPTGFVTSSLTKSQDAPNVSSMAPDAGPCLILTLLSLIPFALSVQPQELLTRNTEVWITDAGPGTILENTFLLRTASDITLGGFRGGSRGGFKGGCRGGFSGGFVGGGEFSGGFVGGGGFSGGFGGGGGYGGGGDFFRF